MHDNLGTTDIVSVGMAARGPLDDGAKTTGRFSAVCRNAAGDVLWETEWHNLLTTVGKNLLLDEALAGSAYTAAEYMGLISSTSYSALVAADTMTSHAGWLEAGSANAPTYSGNRLTLAWSAASAGVKALSAGVTFTFTGTGTVEGAFIVAGSGASSTVGNTGGVLYAEGTFSPARGVGSSDTLTVTYSTTLT